MKTISLVLAAAFFAVFFAGCASGPAPRLVYKETQFASRLEYLRFCQRFALQDNRCD